MSIRDFASGAVLAAGVVVAIYEIRAYSEHTEPEVSQEGPERGGGQQSLTRPLRKAAVPVSASGELPESTQTAGVTSPVQIAGQLERATSSLEDVERERKRVQREKQELEGRVQNLEGELADRDRYEYDLDQEDWKELAGQARIKYRAPCMMPLESGWAISAAELDELGLSPEDGEILAAAHRRSNERVWNAVRPECLKVVGDASVVQMIGSRSCRQLIERVAGKADLMAVMESRRQVGEVHAGLRPPPEAGQELPPLFETFMVLTSEGQRFESDLAKSFGPEEAKRIWQSMSCASSRN